MLALSQQLLAPLSPGSCGLLGTAAAQPLLASAASNAHKPDCMFFIRGYCSKGDKCIFRHNEKAKNGSLDVCPYWERSGKCDDPGCVHLHPKQTGPLSPKTPPQTPPSHGVGQSLAIPWVRRPDCMFFIRGSCSKGDRCAFRHNDKAKLGPHEPCEQWERLGVCEDRTCIFLHPRKGAGVGASPQQQQQAVQEQQMLQQLLMSPPVSPPVLGVAGKVAVPGMVVTPPRDAAVSPNQVMTACADALESAPGRNLSLARLAVAAKVSPTALPPLLRALSDVFLVSDTAPPHVWLLKGEVEEAHAMCDCYTLLCQLPRGRLIACALAAAVNAPKPLLEWLKTHPELFSVAQTLPVVVRLAASSPAETGVTSEGTPVVPKMGDAVTASPAHETSVHPASLTHVLEFYNFQPNKVRTRHLERVLQPYVDSLSVRVKWVDDCHALAIFGTSETAKKALAEHLASGLNELGIKMRPFAEACCASHALALSEEWGRCAHKPKIRPSGGLLMGPVEVTIDCDTPGAAIHYTIDGYPPDSVSSPLYSGPFTLNGPATIQARAFKTATGDSKVAVAKFVRATDDSPAVTPGTPATPVASVPSTPSTPQTPSSFSPLSPPFSPSTPTLPNPAPTSPTSAVSPKKARPSLTISVPTEQPAQEWIVSFTKLVFATEGKFEGDATLQRETATCEGRHVRVRRVPDLAATECALFQHELFKLKDLQHEHVVPVLGVCMPPDPFCVITSCDGDPSTQITLADLISPSALERAPLAKRLGWCLDVAHGLAYLHSQKILHLSLHPANVIVCITGGEKTVCRLTDTGVGKLSMLMCLKPTVSTSMDTLHTMSYIAPEVLCGTPNITPKADVYSLGMITWQATMRQRPYARFFPPEASATPQAAPTAQSGVLPPALPASPVQTQTGAQLTPAAVAVQLLREVVVRGKRPKMGAGCPHGIAKVVSHAWAKDPRARPSADAVSEELAVLAATITDALALVQ
eukprot:TRINITY_DN2787_c0_g1_i2.p1 TRINITY_DN2787_c0_g1~~TRINITY_DN2787_c0_g1_i2.p1  ORF type:complete len:1112 (-),score=192.03 TRINITY_DN2787_c0_g1_i2:25-2958(-)